MDDVTQHSNRRLSTILRNPSHPLHSAAKAERDRRMTKREGSDLEEGPFKGIGKMMMKRKLKKQRDAQGDANDRAWNDLGRHLKSPSDIKNAKSRDAQASTRAYAKTDKALRRLQREDNDLDEINLKDLTKTIAKSTGTKNIQKAMKKSKDQTKMDLAALRKKLQAEKTLTPAEIKKREEIAKAMERDNPDMPMAKKMAIATATAKKVAEDTELQEGVIDQVKDIAAKKQAKKINGVMVDMFTASAISKVYDAVNDANKAKMEKLPITKLADIAMKMMKRESVELDEDVTHQTVKPPNHTKKYSGDAHAFGSGKNKPKVVTSSQADAHDRTADHHRTVADAHRAAAKKTSSMKLKHLHNTAANAHDKAAEAHNDSSHSSDGSLTKTAGHMSRAYHSTMSANDASKRARNLGTKTKRMNEETLEENRVDALAKDFHNRLKKAGNSDRNQNRERMATLAKAKKQGLSPIEMKQLDGKMNAIMNKMDGLVEAVNVKGIQKAVDDGKSMDAIMTMFANKRTTNTDEIRKVVKDYMWKKRMKKEEVELDEISAKKYHAALKGREYKRDRARNSAAANQFVGKDAEAQADMAKSKDHDRKLKKMKQMGINRTARNLGEKAPKIDDEKYAAHMARHDKPKKMTSTQKSLADIRKKSESVSEKYKLHHKTMSAALQHAYDEAEKRGYEVDKDDIDRKVASGPRKPSSGKTNSYSLGLTKNGKPVKQKLQVQVYNMDNKGYELNMYVS